MPYEYPTNYSNETEVTGPGSFFLDWPVSVIPNYGNAILILIFIFTFVIGSIAGTVKGFVVALFITSVLSVYFAVQGWVNLAVPIGLFIVMVIIIIIAIFEGRSGSTI